MPPLTALETDSYKLKFAGQALKVTVDAVTPMPESPHSHVAQCQNCICRLGGTLPKLLVKNLLVN